MRLFRPRNARRLVRLTFGWLTGASLWSARASAFEAGQIGDQVLRVDVTNASSVIHNFDNRDTKPHQVTSVANDDWGIWYNRLNLQANTGVWNAGVRVDSAWFYTSPDPTELALDLTERRGAAPAAAEYFRLRLTEAGTELSNRYINWTYPAKYYLGYTSRHVEATAGDFYAQLGRGFVLSVRKQDELASDTTVRGLRLTAKTSLSSVRLRMTGLLGVMNPLRIDESSGRYLGVDDSVTPGVVAVTEAGMPRAVPTDFVEESPDCRSFGTCTYAPDRLAAAQVEVATDDVKLGTQGSLLSRQEALSADVSRSSETILTASQSVEFPDLDGHGAAYLEAALQNMDRLDPGYALYGSLTVIELPVTVLVEGKHYRRFFPLSANVKLANAREFNLVQYNAPPTAEAFWVDTLFENFNTCASGGRVKADLQVGDDEGVFVWLGRSYSWAESVANEACEIDDQNLNRVWDLASGFDITSQQRRSRGSLTIGGRIDETDAALDAAGGRCEPGAADCTHVFYEEGYVRYDVIRSLGGPFALQFQGWHRKRRQTIGGPGERWFEGFHTTGFSWSPHVSLAFGIEYDTRPAMPGTYFNGQLGYKFTPDTGVSLFVGQRRGALRCVGGVCRVFPPFEGARLDFTARF
jgi:hypothetical protein